MTSTPTQKYDPTASRLTDTQLMAWMELKITGDLKQIPGVGVKTAGYFYLQHLPASSMLRWLLFLSCLFPPGR